jgi:S-adenosylmethionine uptake transporter
MPASLTMLVSVFLFSLMALGVKLSSAHYHTGEIVLYRGIIGALGMAAMTRRHGGTLRTAVPGLHLRRNLAGVGALCLWYTALAHLPLSTSITLNYLSSIWMAVLLVGAALLRPRSGSAPDPRLVVLVVLGFAGVALVLRPTFEQDQLGYGIAGLLSGLCSAVAYLQVGALGRAGEPETRVVFYFSLANIVVGLLMSAAGGLHGHTLKGALLVLSTGTCATLAQVLMTRAYTVGRPLTNASLQYLGIAFGCGWGIWLFDDPVTATTVAGIALIVAAGLAATQLRSRLPSTPSTPGTLR